MINISSIRPDYQKCEQKIMLTSCNDSYIQFIVKKTQKWERERAVWYKIGILHAAVSQSGTLISQSDTFLQFLCFSL